MKTGVILVAAGTGRRFGRTRPKQYETLNQRPLFVAALAPFLMRASIKEVAIVAQPEYFPFISRQLKIRSRKIKIHLVAGGAFRGASVKNGLRALSPRLDVVLVHDAARPLVTTDIVTRVEAAAYKHGAALAAWPLPDTLKLATPRQTVRKTIPRKNLWLAQTPQGFRMNVAQECLTRPAKNATDDVELAERRGRKVLIIEGAPTNFKVTYPHDLALCRTIYGKK